MIILLALSLTCINIRMYNENKQENDAVTVSNALILVFFCIFLSTEAFSLVKGLTKVNVFAFWLSYIMINIAIFRYKIKLRRNIGDLVRLNNLIQVIKENWKILIPYIIISCTIIVFAYCTAPYNVDSFTCYLARVFHWSVNKNVNHYAANDMMQITTSVFADYIKIHVYLLSGYSDRLIPSVQAFACILSMYLIGRISRMLGLSRCWALFSGFVFISQSIVFAEALNAQYDLITAMVFLSGVVSCLHLRKILYNKSSIPGIRQLILPTLFTGVGFGLAVLTKEYAGLPIALICIWLVIDIGKNCGFRLAIVEMASVALGGIVCIIPEKIRLYSTIHSVFAPSVTKRQLISTIDPRYVFVNYIKELFFNFYSPYIQNSDVIVKEVVSQIADVFNVDILDPKIGGGTYNFYAGYFFNADSAPNLVIILLYIIAIIILLVLLFQKKASRMENLGFHICSVISLTVFLAIMRFTANRTRYEISFYSLICISAGYLLSIILDNRNIMVKTAVVSTIVTICCLDLINLTIYHYGMMRSHDARFVPSSYDSKSSITYLSFIKIRELVDEYECKKLGNHFEEGTIEYPLLVMLKDKEVKNINIANETSVYEDDNYIPDCLIYYGIRDDYKEGDIIDCHGERYEVVYEETRFEDYHLDAFAIKASTLNRGH